MYKELAAADSNRLLYRLVSEVGGEAAGCFERFPFNQIGEDARRVKTACPVDFLSEFFLFKKIEPSPIV